MRGSFFHHYPLEADSLIDSVLDHLFLAEKRYFEAGRDKRDGIYAPEKLSSAGFLDHGLLETAALIAALK